MVKVEIGLVLKDDFYSRHIYDQYEEYFEVDDISNYLRQYILIKEPTDELRKSIVDSYEKIKRNVKEYNEFTDFVVNNELNTLSENDKKYLFMHPSVWENLDSYGKILMDKYIYNSEYNMKYKQEFHHLSTFTVDVYIKLTSHLIGYDYNRIYYRNIYNNEDFSTLRRLYHYLFGEFPNHLIDKYADDKNFEEAQTKLNNELKTIIFNDSRYQQLCDKNNYNIEDYINCDKITDTMHNYEF